jgi:hypothetical protein
MVIFMVNQDSSDSFNKEQTVVASQLDTLPANLDKPLDISDMVTDVPLSKETAVAVEEWRVKQCEKTRSSITTMLMVVFAVTMACSFVLTGVAAFNKDADKTIIQSQIALAMNATTALLSSAMGYYFGTQKNK